MKTRLLIFCLMTIFISGYAVMKKDSAKIESTSTERIFIDFEYLQSINNIKYRMRCTPLEVNLEDEFTWWNHYTLEDYESLSKHNGFVLPEEIDWTNHDVIISFGRELQYLYYYEDDCMDEFFSEEDCYYTTPIFKKEYVHDSAHVYLIDKINLADSEFSGWPLSDLTEENIYFELPSIEVDEANKWIRYE